MLGGATGESFTVQAASHGVAAGMLNVTQVIPEDTNSNAQVTLALGVDHFLCGSFNRGDYNVQIGIGMESTYDEDRGVLMTSVTENGRDNFGTNGYPISTFATSGGGYRITSHLGTSGGAGNSIEYNVNVAGAWFPYDRYLGGFARNSAGENGETNDLFTGSPGLVLGTHFRGVAGGKSVVDLRSLGIDSRTSGVLLVTHAKDECNYALSQVNTNDGTWNVFVRDPSQGTYSSYEQDPVAFVFIPRTNTTLISGRFNGNGSISMFSGLSPQFTVTNVAQGRWDLRIPGHSPTNGVLIISPEGGGNLNGDNIVSYQAYTNGSGWEIQSRDTPNNGLQTPMDDAGGPEAAASFVFIPQPPPGFAVTSTNALVTTGSGGKASFSVRLQSPPTAVVTLDVSSSDPAKGVPVPGMLIFDANNWFQPQTVTVTGQNGTSDGSYTILLAPASSADPGYQGLDPEDVSVSFLAARATVIAPANNATQVNRSPTLQVAVTNTTPGNLAVRFYGREAPTVLPGPDFCIAVMPDTQMYTAEKGGGTRYMMIAQTEWAISNRVSRNVAYVSQLGDISNNGDTPSYISQWYHATNAMYRLENPVRTQLPDGMAYGVALGNHEQSPNGWATFGTTNIGTVTNFNKYFGVSHFAGREYYAGHYSTNNNNHFDFFSASGLDFVVLYFEYSTNPPVELLAWGNQVLATNAHRRAIVVTHYMGSATTPCAHSAQGRAIYDALKGNTNLFLLLGGHVFGEGSREDVYNGNTVRTLISDYQAYTNGGNGLMRLMDFSPSNNVVVVQTYSPWTGEYETDEDSEFYFSYDMQPTGPGTATPFIALATNLSVVPGEVCALSWPGLKTNTVYEWYVAVTDQSATTVTSPVWRFTTVLTNVPPTVANQLRTLTGDTPTNFVLLASDANGDVLTFQTHTAPTHGLLRDFDPLTGAFTYWPVYGYRGTDRFTFSANDGQANSAVATMNLNVVAPPDTNANGLPDSWEASYGVDDPNGDADGDGQSNLAECVANTNPTNAASLLQITDWVRLPNGHVTLAWPSIGGSRYRVQYRNGTPFSGVTGAFTDLVRPLTNELDQGFYGAPSTQSFTDDFTLTGGSPTNHSRYYRIRVER